MLGTEFLISALKIDGFLFSEVAAKPVPHPIQSIDGLLVNVPSIPESRSVFTI